MAAGSGSAKRRRLNTSGCTVSGSPLRPRSRVSPGSPPSWSGCPWLSTATSIAEASRPRRSKLVAMPSGEIPVSNSTVCVLFPRRVVTNAEKPVLCDQPGIGSAFLELRGEQPGNPGERRAAGRAGVAHQRVVAVVHQRRDDDLVDRLQGNGIHRSALRRAREGRGDLGGRAAAITHDPMVHPVGLGGQATRTTGIRYRLGCGSARGHRSRAVG